MYLSHFKLDKQPFSINPDPELYCQLPSHEESFRTVMWSIEQGELIIKITGDIGVGKTLVTRKVVEALKEQKIHHSYIENPNLSAEGIYRCILTDLKIENTQDTSRFDLLKKIHEVIKKHAKKKKPIVLIIDEAQVMSHDVLESLRLLTNMNNDNQNILQIVLFGQLELDLTLEKPELRQLAQRITFSHHLKSMSENELDMYLRHRLVKSGHQDGHIFTSRATKALYNASKGVPRIINILAHKSLLLARIANEYKVNDNHIKLAVKDSKNIMVSNMSASLTGQQKSNLSFLIMATFTLLAICAFLIIRSRV